MAIPKIFLDHHRRNRPQRKQTMKQFMRRARGEWGRVSRYGSQTQAAMVLRIANLNARRETHEEALQEPAVQDQSNRDASIAAFEDMLTAKTEYRTSLRDLICVERVAGVHPHVVARSVGIDHRELTEYIDNARVLARLRFGHVNKAGGESAKESV